MLQITGDKQGVARSKYVGWTDMASAEREPLTGVWRRSDSPTHPPVKKLVGFVSIPGATSSKSGVDMSTPVHPVATPPPTKFTPIDLYFGDKKEKKQQNKQRRLNSRPGGLN